MKFPLIVLFVAHDNKLSGFSRVSVPKVRQLDIKQITQSRSIIFRSVYSSRTCPFSFHNFLTVAKITFLAIFINYSLQESSTFWLKDWKHLNKNFNFETECICSLLILARKLSIKIHQENLAFGVLIQPRIIFSF